MLLVVVHNLHVMRIALCPTETDAPTIIDTYAVLSSAIALQSFQPVAGRSCQVAQFHGSVKLPEFALRHPLELPKAQHTLPSV
jgi:hypothetical protein